MEHIRGLGVTTIFGDSAIVAPVTPGLVRFARLKWRPVVAILVLLLLTATTACGSPPPPPSPIVSPLPVIAPEVWNSRGTVVQQEPFDEPPLDDAAVLGRAWRALYTSVSGLDGGKREISGAFFVPSGTPPKNGWPVVALAHGTVGIGNECGPSRQPDLQGYGFLVDELLSAKYAVAMTDYEGLGESGSHPYLEPRTAAFNTIDAFRALRNIAPDVSKRWIGVGYSQGGQAVWVANELNSFYGNDLQMLGAVSLAPATNLASAAELVGTGALTVEQRALFPMVIVGLGRYNPDLDEQAFLHDATNSYQKNLSHCAPRRKRARTTMPPAPVPWRPVVDRLSDANAVKPDSPQDVAKLQEALRKVAIPERPLDQPMLVISAARDAVVLPEWVRFAVTRSCDLGGKIQYVEASASHEDILWKATNTVDRWIADRFAGIAAPSNCPQVQGRNAN